MKYCSESFYCPEYKKEVIITIAYDETRQSYAHKNNELHRFCKSRDKCNINCPFDLESGKRLKDQQFTCWSFGF